MKLVFLRSVSQLGICCFQNTRRSLPKGFSEGGYVSKAQQGKPIIYTIDNRSDIGTYFKNLDDKAALLKFIKRNRQNLM
jgi:hypothetical protein